MGRGRDGGRGVGPRGAPRGGRRRAAAAAVLEPVAFVGACLRLSLAPLLPLRREIARRFRPRAARPHRVPPHARVAVHDGAREVRALVLALEERGQLLRGEERFLGAGHHALRTVLEPDDDVLGDVVDLPDPVPVRDVVARAELAHLRHAPSVDAAHERAVGEAQVEVEVHRRHHALRAQGVRGARDDVSVQERAVHDSELGVRLDLHAVGRAQPGHLAVVLRDGLIGCFTRMIESRWEKHRRNGDGVGLVSSFSRFRFRRRWRRSSSRRRGAPRA